MGKQKNKPFRSANQIVSTQIPFESSNQEKPGLIVKGLIFYKLGAFTVDETIAYELFTNNASSQILEVMLLAQEIAHDLEWTYRQSIEAINSCGQVIIPELIGYAHRLKEVGIFGYSDHERKKDLVTLFINQRLDHEWPKEKTGKLLAPELAKIYDFMMNEFHEWPAPKPPISDAEVGKPSTSYVSHAPQNPKNIGESAMNLSNQPESPILASTDLSLVLS